MMVVTSNEIPGWEIQRVCGEVFGLTVRSRNAFSQMGAGLKSMFGGELQGMTRNLIDSRNEVMGRMLEAARQKGGNAVVCMRFDTSEMADTWTELCAYGTAVVAIPVSDAAKETARAMGYGAPSGSPASPEPVAPMAGGYGQPGYGQPGVGQPGFGQPGFGPAGGPQGPPPGMPPGPAVGTPQGGPHGTPPGYPPQGYPQQSGPREWPTGQQPAVSPNAAPSGHQPQHGG